MLAPVPLPSDANAAWPPADDQPYLRDVATADAWYSGDPAALAKIYTSADDAPRTIVERARRWFWGTQDRTGRNDPSRLHLPAAADIASTSADLLFGDTPTLKIPAAHEARVVEADEDDSDDGQVEVQAAADPRAVAAEERLAELVELDGIASTLLEAAEVGSALGGVYLRPTWDVSLVERPILTVVHADRAVPEFRLGQLTAVTFWRIVKVDGAGAVWRHLERHEPGQVEHGLYVGTKDHIGGRIHLDRHQETAALLGEHGADDDGVVVLPGGIVGLGVRYVPNVLPNRKHRARPLGRADTQGVEGLMDALDETWTSWLRDIRLGKARIIVPDEFIDRSGGRGAGASFDLDQEVFSPLGMDPSSQEKAGITPSQFAIRTEEHARTALALFESVARTAGYSPQSFGMEGNGAQQTATEVDAREDRSTRTTNRKRRYWRSAIEDVMHMMLVIDAEIFSSGVEPMRPSLEWAMGGSDLRETASSLNLINLAQAASIETRVRMLHPDWDEPDVVAEVAKVREEIGVAAPDPTGGLP